MTLLARYHLASDCRMLLMLHDLETAEPVNVIADTGEGRALIDEAREWAAQYGHEVAVIDCQVLRDN